MRKLPKIILQDEFELLLKHTLKMKHKQKKQYALAILLAFEAGLRISEIVGLDGRVPALTKDKINLDHHTIRIEDGKGKKDRIVPLPKRVNANAVKLLPILLSRRSLQRYVTEIGGGLLGKKITFHTLRHGFGSHLAAMGRPLHEIMMLMGHTRLDTTGIYLHANPTNAIEGARDVF